jgi:hypothetical protein
MPLILNKLNKRAHLGFTILIYCDVRPSKYWVTFLLFWGVILRKHIAFWGWNGLHLECQTVRLSPETSIYIYIYISYIVYRLKISVDFSPVHAIKTSMSSRGMAPLILNLGASWRWKVNITFGHRVIIGKRAPGIQWVGSLVGPKIALEFLRKKFWSCWEANPRTSSTYTNHYVWTIVRGY